MITLAIFTILLTAAVSVCLTIVWVDWHVSGKRFWMAQGMATFLCFALGSVASQLFKALAALP